MRILNLVVLLYCIVSVVFAEIEYDAEKESMIANKDENENETNNDGSGSGSGIEASDEEEEEEKEEEEEGDQEETEDQENDRAKRTDEEVSSDPGSGDRSFSNLKEAAPEKKTEINGQRPKGLTSNTEVSVPAGVLAKVFGSNNNSASFINTPDQSIASEFSPESSETISAPVDDATMPAEKRGNLKPKPIGPMETLEVKIEGKASTKNNFTRGVSADDVELEFPQQNKIDGKNVVRKSITEKKHAKKAHKKNNKKSKRSRVAFPKIILYQGPLSKAIEKMLYSKASNEKKRSEIEKLFRSAKTEKKKIVKDVNEEDEIDEKEDSEDNEHQNTVERNSKKSTVLTAKKYKVKGFVDNVQVDDTVTKKSKTEKFEQEASDKRYKPSVIESDEIMRQHLNNMIKNNSPYSRSFVSQKSKITKANKKPNKFTSNQPPMVHLKDSKNEEDEVSGEDDDEREDKKTGLFSGEDENEKKENNDDNDNDEEGSSDEDDDASATSIGIQDHNPNEPKPEPVKEEPATLPQEPKPQNVPVSPDGPSVGNLPAPVQNKPSEPVDTSPPSNEQPLVITNPISDSSPPPMINPTPGQEENPEPTKESQEDQQSYIQDELMTQVDLNSQSIEALTSRVTELEGKEKELETAMGSISEGLERIEKKLDTQQHKQPISSFNDFMPNNLPQARRRPKILKEIFIPLPLKGSSQAQAIESGRLFNSPVLNRLPLPIRRLVSSIFKQQLKKEEDRTVMTDISHNASEEPDEPAKEHDLDKLELQLGRIPISRHGLFQQMPKLLVFAKAPRFTDLMTKPCYKPCQNGGRCLGNNVCRCYHGFIGPQCQHRIRPTIVEIIGSSPIQMFPQNRNSHQIALPFAPVIESNASDGEEEEDNKQKTVGHVDQSKLVNILRKFTLPFKTFMDESENNYEGMPFKRHYIPRRYVNPPEYQRYNRRRGNYYRYY